MKNASDDAANANDWESRRKGNLRLALLFGAFAVGIFLIALWKFRPI